MLTAIKEKQILNHLENVYNKYRCRPLLYMKINCLTKAEIPVFFFKYIMDV